MNLKVKINSLGIGDNNILQESQFELNSGDVVAIVGPNGAGKSTLLHAIAGREDIDFEGSIKLNEVDLSELDITERSKEGVFLSWQHPPAIGGVSNFGLLKEIVKEDIMQLLKSYKAKLKDFNFPDGWQKRNFNEGASGGERKKNELLQMSMIQPKLAMLDEIDSGLDVDGIKTYVDEVQKYSTNNDCIMMFVGHNLDVINKIQPNKVLYINNKTVTVENTEFLQTIKAKGFNANNS